MMTQVNFGTTSQKLHQSNILLNGRCSPGARHACSIGMPVAPAAVGRDALAALDTFLADVKHVQVLLHSRCRCVSCMPTRDQVCYGRATAGHVVNYAAAVVQRVQSMSAVTQAAVNCIASSVVCTSLRWSAPCG